MFENLLDAKEKVRYSDFPSKISLFEESEGGRRFCNSSQLE